MESIRPSVGSAPPRPTRQTCLRRLLGESRPTVFLEAHDALSARIIERGGLQAIWASSLTMSAVWGTRDANELTWTQVADSLESMADATSIPILADGDSGHGDFNTVRRFVRRLSGRGIAGVCFEDQQFPKFNSLHGNEHELAPIEVFCGKIQAAKDAQLGDDFVVVARVEALIAGLGMSEALRRAEAYHEAGADGILIHSRRSDPSDVLQFAREWDARSPILIVPTTYSGTPISTYVGTGVAGVIWANHTLRAAISGMTALCEAVAKHGSPVVVEPGIASVKEIFDLTDLEELVQARTRYTGRGPSTSRSVSTTAGDSAVRAEVPQAVRARDILVSR